MTLRISPDLGLPLESVTETFAILAVKRAGKSNAAVVMAEEMYDAGVPWVAVDPKGDWWGVRAAGDGQAPGLSVLVFGGLHGDVPLEPTAGNLVADLIVEQRVTCVLDVSEMSKADQRRFLTDFASRLYRRNTEPLHVFCEEADEYIPQRVIGETAKLVGAFETLVKRGGFRGIGVTLITQRSASLNKDVLTQAGTLIAMRTPSPQDRKAVLAWIDYHAASKDVIDELPTLPNGAAWLFSSGEQASMTKLTFRRRRTFDSGATPKVGGKPRPPARLADVDLAAIKEAMADTIERAKADDPRELRRQIAELNRGITELAREQQPQTVEVPVEVSVLTDTDRALIEQFIERWDAAYDTSTEVVNTLRGALAAIERTERLPAAAKQGSPSQRGSSAATSRVRPDDGARLAPSGTAETGRSAGQRPEMRPDAPAGELSGPQRRILDALAWLAAVGIEPASRIQVGMIAGYHPRTKGFTNGLGTLSSGGYVTYPQPGYVALTDAGAGVAEPPDVAPTTDHLQQMVFAQVGNARARILREVIAVYPDAISRADLAARLEYHERTKGFTNGLGSLRTLGLIEYPSPGLVTATELLFLEGSR